MEGRRRGSELKRLTLYSPEKNEDRIKFVLLLSMHIKVSRPNTAIIEINKIYFPTSKEGEENKKSKQAIK